MFSSVVLIHSNTQVDSQPGCVHPFLSVVLIYPNTGEWLTYWTFTHSHQWFWSVQTLESDLLPGCTSFFSDSELLKHWRATHILDICPFLSVVLICPNTGEWLTLRLCCIFTHSCQWFWSNQTLESNSLPGSVFTHSHWWFWSNHTMESNSLSGCVFTQSHQWFWSNQTMESDSLSGCMFTHSRQCFWSNQTLRATHTLDMCSPFLISGSDLLKCSIVTHGLDACSAILVSVPTCSYTWE